MENAPKSHQAGSCSPERSTTTLRRHPLSYKGERETAVWCSEEGTLQCVAAKLPGIWRGWDVYSNLLDIVLVSWAPYPARRPRPSLEVLTSLYNHVMCVVGELPS
jgi:hypothetical protein